MGIVAVKSIEQQAILILDKTHDLLIRQLTALINALRAHLAEYSNVMSKSLSGVAALMRLLHEVQE
jgi:transposase